MTKLFVSLALTAAAAAAAVSAHAEDKTCAVKGMHCTACTEMVQGKICEEGKYSKCDVKITNEKKEMGEIHLVTKEADAKIDENAVGAAVKDAGYTLQKCKPTAASKSAARKTKG